jgi:hypothetical protein
MGAARTFLDRCAALRGVAKKESPVIEEPPSAVTD